MSVKNRDKVLVIVGPTGSGKTGLAIDVALELDGEVISADSRAIYRGMDIGTAKPSREEMRGVAHWGIDLVGPNERFTVADFKVLAEQKIKEIRAKSKLAIVAGGTGLYIDALVYDYQFNDIVKKTCSDRTEIDSGYIIIGIKWTSEELRDRLKKRASNFFVQGLEAETMRVAEKYDWNSQAMKSNVYPIVRRLLQKEIKQEEAIELLERADWQLARRQMTWFRRTPEIIWLRLDEAGDYIYNIFK